MYGLVLPGIIRALTPFPVLIPGAHLYERRFYYINFSFYVFTENAGIPGVLGTLL